MCTRRLLARCDDRGEFDHQTGPAYLVLIVVALLFVSSPAIAADEVLFDDNFDSDTVGLFPNNPAVGTWSLYGDGNATVSVTNDASPGPVSVPNYFKIQRMGDWDGADANFTRQTTATDLVRVEFDYYATTYFNGEIPTTGYINLNDSVGVGEFQYFMPSANGAVVSGGGNLSGLVLDAWNHWTIDYIPGAGTMDVTIAGTLNPGVAMYATPVGIDSFHFSSLYSGTGYARFDNAKVTLNPSVAPPDLNFDVGRGRQIMLDRGLQIQALVGTHSDAVWVGSHFTTLTSYHNPTGAAYHLPSLIANEPRPGATLWGRTWDLTPASQNLTTTELPYVDRFVSFGYRDEVADPFDPARQAHMAATYATWNSLYPGALTYMNHYGSLFNPTTLATYMANTNPDMIVFDSYVPQFYTKAQRYAHMQLHRTAGLAGIDGTGDMPIPYGQFLNMYRPTYADPLPSESSIRLQYFDSWAFGFTWVSAYTFDDIAPFSSSGGDPVMFSTPGCGSPTQTFYDVAETNRQSRNLGPALVRLVSTDIRMIRGKVNGILNDPIGISLWMPGAGFNSYITGITPLGDDLANPSTTNYSDVLIGYFEPLLDDNTGYSFVDGTHFMIVNGATTGTAAESAQWYNLTFDFTGSDFDSLSRLSRHTGIVELVPLTNTGESLYSLDLNLPGGTGDLFGFWDSSSPLPTMPEPYLSPGDANSDGTVDAADAAILATNWQTATGATWADGDFNNDYAVNDIDATILAANWGSGTSASVPEPSTLTLLGIGIIGFLVSAWRRRYNS